MSDQNPATRATGLGGVFFRAEDPAALTSWYERHLGLKPESAGVVLLKWRHADDPDKLGHTVWGVFPKDTDYFGPGGQSHMLNYRVDDLEGLIATLRQEGVEVAGEPQVSEYGSFAWIVDLEGNRIELWQPPPGQ